MSRKMGVSTRQARNALSPSQNSSFTSSPHSRQHPLFSAYSAPKSRSGLENRLLADKHSMPALPLAYLIAAALIGFMLFLARRNQKQGWQRERNAWGQVKSPAALASIEQRIGPTSEHFSDLAR